MIWLLAHRRMSTKLAAYPYTETTIEGGHSLLYKPGVEPVLSDGLGEPPGSEGTYSRGMHRASGYVFTYNGDGAEALLGIDDDIDLIVYYLANRNQHRKRTISGVVFAGDATVVVPGVNAGLGDLIGVPFKVSIAQGETLADHIVDEAE